MIPATILTGTIGYIILCVGLLFGVQSSKAAGLISKDNSEIANVVIGVASFSMWLFWLCAWMHQWHPLIKPIYEG